MSKVNEKPMTMAELKDRLWEMAKRNGGIVLGIHDEIINTILRIYATRSDYYEWDAIASMKKFLERGVLSFESSKESRRIYCALAH